MDTTDPQTDIYFLVSDVESKCADVSRHSPELVLLGVQGCLLGKLRSSKQGADWRSLVFGFEEVIAIAAD